MIRLGVRVNRAAAEQVLADLLQFAPAGVEEREINAETIEYSIYGTEGELPGLPTLQAVVGEALVEVKGEQIADDWSERWKQFHRPVTIAWLDKQLRIVPPWETTSADRNGSVSELQIDPGQAFGTGAHPTSQLCLQLLLSLSPGGSFADWGCGSGVVAIAAARLGFDPVYACDFDPLAIAATNKNAAANSVCVTAQQLDLRKQTPPQSATVVANLIYPLLLELARAVTNVPRQLIISGLLVEQTAEVVAAFSSHGLTEVKRIEQKGWVASLLKS